MTKTVVRGWPLAVGIPMLCLIIIFAIAHMLRNGGDAQLAGLPPNVFIIIMDTARQDHLACYGYERANSPNLDRLVGRARTYYEAYSTSCWTSPAHASLFTGLLPVTHRTTQEDWTMSQDLETLAEVLSAEGYETVGIVENPMLARDFNFDQGFSTYHQTWKRGFTDKVMIRLKRENIAFYRLKQSLGARDRRKPLFVFMNFIEPHSPYNSSGGFRDMFVSDPSIEHESNMWTDHFLGRVSFSAEEVRHLTQLYDAEIMYVDHWVGRIIEDLKERDLWQNTLFIVTSDHGENIGDHGMMDHVFCLYESTIKIPLIVHYPELFPPGSEDHSVVRLTDIFPTVLDVTGIGSEKYPSHGRSLLAEPTERSGLAFSEYYYPEQALSAFDDDRDDIALRKYKRRLRSITRDGLKLIWGSDGNHELYDLAHDPDELVNLIDDNAYAGNMQEMTGLLEKTVNDYGRGEEAQDSSRTSARQPLDNKTRDALKSLGYIR